MPGHGFAIPWYIAFQTVPFLDSCFIKWHFPSRSYTYADLFTILRKNFSSSPPLLQPLKITHLFK